MTPEEFQSGLLRLAVVTLVLVALTLVASAGFWLFGARGRAGAAAGSGTVGILLIFGGVAAFAKASPVRHVRAMPYASDTHREERRETERLALGLFAYGIAFSVISLVLG